MTMISFRVRASIALLACLVLAVTSCTRDEPKQPPAAPPPAGWPTALDSFTIAWTAEPGIDLAKDGAVIAARAYVESYFLAVITENDKYLYPGFADAVEPDQTGGPPGTRSLHPEIGSSDPSIYIGTARHHVLSIARANRDVTLTACAFTYGSAIQEPDGMYSAIVGKGFAPNPGIYPMRIGLRAPTDKQSGLPPQQGPSRTPLDNVFGGWKITNLQGGFLSSTVRWADYGHDRATCIAKAVGLPGSERLYPHVPSPASDFPTLPATPGWPDKSAS
jgi:hypothetical protein